MSIKSLPSIKTKPDNELYQFFLIAFLVSWVLWAPRMLNTFGWIKLPDAIDFILGILPVFGPGIGAFWLTARKNGGVGAKALWQRGWRLKFEKVWLIPAVFLIPLIAGLTTLILMLMDIEIPWEYSLPPAMIVPIFFLLYLSAMGEEYGWRGYALDRLQARWTPLQASLILGLIWGLWHLPLFFISGTTQSVIPVWQFILQTIVLSVLYSWLYNKTRSSVMIVIVFHAFANLTGALVPTWVSNTGRWVNFVLIIVAIITMAMVIGIRNYRRS